MRRPTIIACLALASVARAAEPAPEPPNLGRLKQQIRTYVASGDYDRAVASVAARACAWLESRARVGLRPGAASARLTLVMDLDDTLLRDVDQIASHDFAYDPGAWNAWVQRADAPAMDPVREVYRTARRLGIAVVFLTSRPEHDRAATERNLRAIGCGEFAALICQPDASHLESGAFKRAERERLTAAGGVIIANVGDQTSDFEGGGAERDFKIPNPFYFTP